MRLASLALAVALAAPAAASAAVVAQTDQGFRVSSPYEIAAPVSDVWMPLVKPGRWWNPQHSWFGHSGRDFRLDLKPDGCFCEIAPDGASAMHMRVTFIKPKQELRLWGALG